MLDNERQPSETGLRRYAVGAAIGVTLSIVVLGVVALLYGLSDQSRSTNQPPGTGADQTPVSNSNFEEPKGEDEWATTIVEHCQMSIRYPSYWHQGTNQFGASYIANYPPGSERPADGVTVELCPPREGNFEPAGEPFEFPGGFVGSIIRGGIHGTGKPEQDIDLLYQDNRVTWFLSASFAEHATDENPATAEFFSVIDTIEYFDSGKYVHEPPAETPDEARLIDPLFITYACNQRQDPSYDQAVETWGYLTHGGKEVVCLEYQNGNYDFVAHHQTLIETEAEELVQHYTGRDNYSGARWVHETSPENFYLNAAASGGLARNQPTGGFLLDTMSYREFDVLFQARANATDMLSIAELEYFISEWAANGQPFGYSNAGEALAPSLTGQRDTHFRRRLDEVNDVRAQYLMIYEVIEALHYPSRWRWDSISSSYERIYELYWSSDGSLWFHEWLIENPDLFLDHYWPSEDWTPNQNE